MTDQELKKRGHSVPIYRAIEAAGGVVNVAYHMGLKTTVGVNQWYMRGVVPAERILKLCELGGNKITPEMILKDMEQRAARREAERATA